LTEVNQYGGVSFMKLRQFLDSTSRTVADGARETGYPHETFRKWVTGERVPREEALKRIRQWSEGQVQPNDFFASEASEGEAA
jgi:hypothetical protein